MKIESVKGGRLVGVVAEQPGETDLTFTVEVDGQQAASGKANHFRPAPLNSLDVDDPAQGGHYGGFSIPLDAHWYDGGTHAVVLKDAAGAVLGKRRCAFPVNSNAQYLLASVLLSHVYTPYVSGKKVAIVAAFSADDQVSECQKWLLRYLYEQGYYVVLSLALPDDSIQHQPLNLAGLCHALLVRRNVGYDFGSWAHAWLRWGKQFKAASEVLFINDSIVGPLVPGTFQAEFDALDYDLCGVTESYQHTWHVQSYWWRVRPPILAGAHLDQFFVCRQPVAANKEDAIAHFELILANYFRRNGFSVGVWASLSRIKALAFDSFQQTLQHRLMVDSLTYQNPALANAVTSLLAEKARPYLAALLSDQHQNPAQHYWKGLIELGFPFIKKELLTKNPIEYPFVDEMSGFFDSDTLRPVFTDLMRRSSPSVAHITFESPRVDTIATPTRQASTLTDVPDLSDLFDLCEDEQPQRLAGSLVSDTSRQWAEDGVVVLRSLFTASEVAAYVTARTANPQWGVTANPYAHSSEVRDLLCHPLLAKALEELLGQPAGLHLNLLSWYSSQRDWHADIYLNPPNVLFSYAAVWIALEKTHPDSGPFQYVPGTHQWPALSQRKVRDAIRHAGLDADAPSWPYESEKILTQLYEKKFAEQGLNPVTYLPEPGDVLIWHPNLAHRGSKAVDPSRPRLAAIGHFSGVGVRPDMPAPVQHGQGGWYFPIADVIPL